MVVSFYMLDLERLLNENIIQLIYLRHDEILQLPYTGEELFQKAVQNTEKILQLRLIPFSTYIDALIPLCREEIALAVMRLLVHDLQKLPSQQIPWCIASNTLERGACGIFCLSLLKEFCEKQYIQKILLGIGSNDFAFVFPYTEKNERTIRHFVFKAKNTETKTSTLTIRAVMLYDYEKNDLKMLEVTDE